MKKLTLSLIVMFLTFATAHAQWETPKEPKPVKVPKVPRSFFNVSEAEEKEYLENIDPELIVHLNEIKKMDKERYLDFLRELHFKNIDLPLIVSGENDYFEVRKERSERRRKMLELEIMTESLSAKYKSGDGDKNSIKKELNSNLAQLFDLREEERQYEVERLERKIEELKKKLDMRSKNKGEIIRRRLEDLLGDKEYYKWE